MVALMFSVFGNVSAAEKNGFNLIDYLENNEVTSNAELCEVIAMNSGELPMTMYTQSLTYVNDFSEEEISFNYVINYENQTVEFDTVYQLSATTYTTAGRATHEVYSDIGKLLYTINVTGSFARTTQSVSCSSKSGSFTQAVGSTWTSTAAVSSGNYSRTQAYARTYGTAQSLLQSKTYQLTLVCDTAGTLSSTFAGT